MGALEKNVLVLNANWQPINIKNAFEAICDVYSGKAHIIGSDYRVYNFDDWVEDWADAVKMAKLSEDQFVSCVNYDLVIPEIIKFKEYRGFKKRQPKLSRSAIFARDDLTCQYCGKQGSPKLFNIDHVMPSSRGGRTTWENVVLSCIQCNTKKGNRTPEEAGMILRKKPVRPHWSTTQRHKFLRSEVPQSWEDFLGKMYWDAKLKD
jgi:5-methylcytosine-specific restriction endonuclease McrA